MWVWILTVLYVIQAIVYFIGAITWSVNIDEVKTDELTWSGQWWRQSRPFCVMIIKKRSVEKLHFSGGRLQKGSCHRGARLLLGHHRPRHDRFHQRHWSTCVSICWLSAFSLSPTWLDFKQSRTEERQYNSTVILSGYSIVCLCRSTMEMLFSVGKITVVLRLLASHVYWIVAFIRVSIVGPSALINLSIFGHCCPL